MKKILFILIFNFLLINKTFALIQIDITRGNLEPLPTAISNFYIDNPEKFSEGIKKLNLESNLPKVICAFIKDQSSKRGLRCDNLGF